MKKIRVVLGIIIAIVVLITSVGTAMFTNLDHNKIDISEQLKLGEKYLREMDYEKAILAFSKVIEVDPMNVRAYLGLADAYLGQGNAEKATEILEKALELTKDNLIKEKLEELTNSTSHLVQEELEEIATSEEKAIDEKVAEDELLHEETVDVLITDEKWWIGRFDEYYSYSNKKFSSEVFKSEYIPYIELFEDGTYFFNLNWYEAMGLELGKWHVDPNNKNIVRLSKPDFIVTEFFFERVSEFEIVLRGTDIVRMDNWKSTSSYGDLYVKRENGLYSESKTLNNYHNYWARVYLDLIKTQNFEKTYYGNRIILDGQIDGLGSIRLIDINSDNTPELFISNFYEDTIYIYSVKEDKPILINYTNDVADISTRRNKITAIKDIFLSVHYNGSTFLKRLNIIDKYAVQFTTLFGVVNNTVSENQVLSFYYVNEIETDKETYQKELINFENDYLIEKSILPHEINLEYYNYDKIIEAYDKLIRYLDSYIISNGKI